MNAAEDKWVEATRYDFARRDLAQSQRFGSNHLVQVKEEGETAYIRDLRRLADGRWYVSAWVPHHRRSPSGKERGE